MTLSNATRVSGAFDGWVFPRSGVAFVWVLDSEVADRPAPLSHAAHSAAATQTTHPQRADVDAAPHLRGAPSRETDAHTPTDVAAAHFALASCLWSCRRRRHSRTGGTSEAPEMQPAQ